MTSRGMAPVRWSNPSTIPNLVFNTYFKGMLPAPPPATGADAGAPAPVDNSAAIRTSILDSVVSDLNRFSKVVGTEDKQSIEGT